MWISIDWSKTYSTIDDNSRKASQISFIDLYNQKKLFLQDEPSFWCSQCSSALAQTDLEDKESIWNLNFIEFGNISWAEKLIISTSRPEMLPACVWLFVNPNDDRYKRIIWKKA